MTEAIDKQTGEIVVSDTQFRPIPMDDMKAGINFVDQVRSNLMAQGTDYGKIPGTSGKPVLLKPGAEKLAFGFGLSPDIEIIEQVIDHDRQWQYQKWDKQTRQQKSFTATGWYRYVVKCTLRHRGTGAFIGAHVGACDSYERGKETAPENTVLKIAQKRAFVGAVCIATYTSDRFDVDIEDGIPEKTTRKHKGQQSPPPPPPDRENGSQEPPKATKMQILTQIEAGQQTCFGDDEEAWQAWLGDQVKADVLSSNDLTENKREQLEQLLINLRAHYAAQNRD